MGDMERVTVAKLNVSSLFAMIFFAIICNILAIVFIFHKDSKTSIKDKVVALLCIINLVQTLGFAIELHSAFHEKIEDLDCQVAAFIVCSATFASIGCFVTLIAERYMSIVYPFKYVVFCTGKPITIVCLISPIVYGLVLGSTPLFGWGKYGRSRPNSTYCGYVFHDHPSTSDMSFFFTVIVLSFGLPLICTILCCVHILCELRRSALLFTREYGKGSNISRDSARAVHHQYVSSLLTGFIYIGSWVPYAVVCIMFYYELDVPRSYEYFSIYLSKSSTITSPVVFCLIEKRAIHFLHEKSGSMRRRGSTSSNLSRHRGSTTSRDVSTKHRNSMIPLNLSEGRTANEHA